MELLVFTLLFALGTFVYAFAGFGGALLVVPIYATFMDLQLALPAMVVAGFCMNLLLLAETRHHVQWNVIKWLLAGAAVGTPLGVWLLETVPQQWTGLTVSLLAILTGLVFLLGWKIPLGPGRSTRIGVGVVAGILSGGTATPGPPLAIYGLAQRWSKDRFRGNLIFFFTGLAAWTLVNQARSGLLTEKVLVFGFATLPPMLVATYLGVRLKQRVSEAWFRVAVLWLLIGTGVIGVFNSLTH